MRSRPWWRALSVVLVAFGVLLVLVVAADAWPTGSRLPVTPGLPATPQLWTVDQFISPRLSPHDRAVMRDAMLKLRPWQWNRVIVVDFASGRVYANTPELAAQVHPLNPVPGHPGMVYFPNGEVRAGPLHLEPPRLHQRGGNHQTNSFFTPDIVPQKAHSP